MAIDAPAKTALAVVDAVYLLSVDILLLAGFLQLMLRQVAAGALFPRPWFPCFSPPQILLSALLLLIYPNWWTMTV